MDKKITLLLAFSTTFPTLLISHGVTSNWYSGNNSGIRFNINGSTSATLHKGLNAFGLHHFTKQEECSIGALT